MTVNRNRLTSELTCPIESSCMFDSNQESFMTWTPESEGNRKTWTFSTWIKRSRSGTSSGSINRVLSTYIDENNQESISIFNDLITVNSYTSGSYDFSIQPKIVLRDFSAWYNLIVVLDTTSVVESDRLKIYLNGIKLTDFNTASYPQLNLEPRFNSIITHYLGEKGSGDQYFDGYLAETFFISGKALDQYSFGKFKGNQWIPRQSEVIKKEYEGSVETNHFYLPYKENSTNDHFNTLTYTGNGSNGHEITGLGFKPDLVWIKSRGQAYSHYMFDSLRGIGASHLSSDSSSAEGWDGTTSISSFDFDGFTLGAGLGTNDPASGNNGFVAWCWSAKDHIPANTEGSITSEIKVNPEFGFSIVSYTGTAVASTIGHGLGAIPDCIIVKNRDNAYNWAVYHSALGGTDRLILDTSVAAASYSNYWNDTDPNSTVFSVLDDASTNRLNDNFIAYCFASKEGYSKIGSYVGNGSSNGPEIDCGFRPSFILIKRTDATGNWYIWDNKRDTNNPNTIVLFPNLSNTEQDNSIYGLEITNDGFKPVTSDNSHNANGGTYIYMAMADTTVIGDMGSDHSGNNNDWLLQNITDDHSTLDCPCDNFNVLSLLDKNSTTTVSDGGLKMFESGSKGGVRSTIGFSSVKFYAEITNFISPTSGGVKVGFCTSDFDPSTSTQDVGDTLNDFGYRLHINPPSQDVFRYNNNQSFISTYFESTDIAGLSFDPVTGVVTLYKNNVQVHTYSITPISDLWYFICMDETSSVNTGCSVNLGQRHFKYEPPEGYKSLSTKSLPNPVIQDPSKGFLPITYTGDDVQGRSITGLDFQPDLVWIKERGRVQSHILHDSVRGIGRYISSNNSNAEAVDSRLSSFDANGFSIGTTVAGVNESTYTYVAWCWKKDPKFGFDIVAYTGNGAVTHNISHNLGQKPSVMFVKNLDSANNWRVYHKELGSSKSLYLNTNNVESTNTSIWDNTEPTNSVFTLGSSSDTNENTSDFIAYLWTEIEGYSKMGSYRGNGSTDGPFIHLGFRPSFVIIKRVDAVGGWIMFDNIRSPHNVVGEILWADTNSSELGPDAMMDFNSNGFKLRDNANDVNNSGDFIYMAFAESPFKTSNAR